MAYKQYRVLVTRPAHQAEELCALIEEQGWLAIRFPTIEIKFLEQIKFPQLNNYSTLIFTSRNSVDAAFQYWHLQDFKSKQVIAIGQATTTALHAQGMEQVILPNGISNSEQLLTIPELQADKIKDENILILSGLGGRKLLQSKLSKSANRVDTLALYERLCPCYDKLKLEQVWDTLPDALVLTSNEAAENLKKILNSTPYERSVNEIPTIVMSQRSQDSVYQMGFHANSWIAETTNVYGLISALKQCFEEEGSE